MINVKHTNGHNFTTTVYTQPAIASVYDGHTRRHERVQPYAVLVMRKTARFMLATITKRT